jgi:hypothetical protein
MLVVGTSLRFENQEEDVAVVAVVKDVDHIGACT